MKRPFRYRPALVASLALFFAAAACGQTVEYIHTDALGSPVAVTDSSGAVIERTVYEPYGAVVNRPLTDGPGFAGHVTDSVTGLVYMQQRYYDPTLGRFLSADPVTADGVSGSNFNRYWYAANNPYKYRDPDGRVAVPVEAIVVGGILLYVTYTACEGSGACESASEGVAQIVDTMQRGAEAIRSWLFSESTKPDEKDKPDQGDGTSNTDKPQEAQTELGERQQISRDNRPSIQEEGEWEEAKSRPKASEIESTKKTDDRARHDLERNWEDYVEDNLDDTAEDTGR